MHFRLVTISEPMDVMYASSRKLPFTKRNKKHAVMVDNGDNYSNEYPNIFDSTFLLGHMYEDAFYLQKKRISKTGRIIHIVSDVNTFLSWAGEPSPSVQHPLSEKYKCTKPFGHFYHSFLNNIIEFTGERLTLINDKAGAVNRMSLDDVDSLHLFIRSTFDRLYQSIYEKYIDEIIYIKDCIHQFVTEKVKIFNINSEIHTTKDEVLFNVYKHSLFMKLMYPWLCRIEAMTPKYILHCIDPHVSYLFARLLVSVVQKMLYNSDDAVMAISMSQWMAKYSQRFYANNEAMKEHSWNDTFQISCWYMIN